MVAKTYKVYGREGHRIKTSFAKSISYDWSTKDKTRKIDLRCFDYTGTHDYVIITIECDTEEECYNELMGQITDGIFENQRTGKIEEV